MKLQDILYKCQFLLDSITFLGYVETKDDIMFDMSKKAMIHDWARPTSPIEILSFVCLVGYY